MNELITINGKKYAVPAAIITHNANASSFYSELKLSEVITGREDFDRIDSEGHDWYESECFNAYGNHHNMNGDDAPINLVGEAMYAWFSDYKGEDHELHLIVEM